MKSEDRIRGTFTIFLISAIILFCNTSFFRESHFFFISLHAFADNGCLEFGQKCIELDTSGLTFYCPVRFVSVETALRWGTTALIEFRRGRR